MKREEDRLQMAFMHWVQLQYPMWRPFIYHIPNGGKMVVKKLKNGKYYCPAGSRLKAMGVKPGVADVLFMFSTKDFGGLFLEFKAPKGKQSPEQKEFEELAHVARYDYQLINNFDDAKEAFERYLSNIND